MRSGKSSSAPKELPFREAVVDPDTRAIYIRRMPIFGDMLDYKLNISSDLQILQWWTEAFLNAILQSTRKMPYSMRYLAREMSLSLRVGRYVLWIG